MNGWTILQLKTLNEWTILQLKTKSLKARKRYNAVMQIETKNK